MIGIKETVKRNNERHDLITELRNAQEAMCNRSPGKPAVFIPLDQVFTFKGENGEPMAVVPVEQVIYLVDQILRDAPGAA